MSKKLFLTLILLVAPVLGQKPADKAGAPPSKVLPEVVNTVDAIKGGWTGVMIATVPGYPSETFDWRMDCKVVARGAGAACTNTGKASIGEMAESCLLAYDPEGRAVHYMCVTSMGEVHDHKGKWIDGKTIEFEPLRAGLMGRLVTETNRWYFPEAGTIDKTSEVKSADGSTMKFEFKGTRQKILTNDKN
jgi:hypothetical protein